MAPAPKIDPRDLAARYGWALSVINSNPDLQRVFNQAVAQTWSPDRFIAEIRNTNWFKQHSDTWRQNNILRETDPTTFNQRFAQNRATIASMAANMGVVMSASTLHNITLNYMNFGYNDAQLKEIMGRFVNFQHGSMTGAAGDLEDQLRQYATQMGVKVSDGWLLGQIRNISSGGATIQNAKDGLMNYAITAFPTWERQIRAGQTMEDIASPYKDAMARTLELDPGQISVFDPTIRKAMMGQTPAHVGQGQANSGAQSATPAAVPLWQFEQQLRQDPRWLKTDNADQALSGVAHKVLQDFGFQT